MAHSLMAFDRLNLRPMISESELSVVKSCKVRLGEGLSPTPSSNGMARWAGGALVLLSQKGESEGRVGR